MPYKDPVQQREYLRQYLERRRANWFIGKSCARCGSQNGLQVDHIDPAQKISHRVWSWSETRREAELAKCQVLCDIHHKEKSAGEKLKGIQQQQARLTEDQVREVRVSKETCRAAGKRLGVSARTVSRIRQRVDWSHIQ